MHPARPAWFLGEGGMARLVQSVNRRRGRLGAGILVAFLPLLAGCANFWEDVTSYSPEPGVWNNVQYRWSLVFNRPDPLQVLASSTDGDMRRRALESLEVEAPWWKSNDDPDLMFRVLSTSAQRERDLICRVMAIEKLGRLKDPRVNDVLVECYNSPDAHDPQLPAVKIAVVKALGARGDAAGMETLVTALKPDNPPDLRQAAADSLGRIKNDQAAGELIRILREDRDVAVKYRAYQSLQALTGRTDLPPKADAWEAQFRQAAEAGRSPYREPSALIRAVSFWGD
jgi:hypothetical protein